MDTIIHQEELKALWRIVESKMGDGWFKVEPLK